MQLIVSYFQKNVNNFYFDLNKLKNAVKRMIMTLGLMRNFLYLVLCDFYWIY